jgi:hypothetical protein
MFGFGGIGLKIAIAAILFSVISGGYFYIKQQQAELELAKEVQAKMEGVIAKQTLSMDNMKADIERQAKVQQELSAKVIEAQQSNQELNKKFSQDANGNERNIGSLANDKPDLVQSKVNQGTKDALRCNEIVTGSPLTEDEQSGKVRNNICPNLLPKPEVKKK